MIRDRGGGGGYLMLSPQGGVCVIDPGKDGALMHAKLLGSTLVVEYASLHIKIGVCDRSPGVVNENQVCNHICQEMRSPHGGMRGSWFC